jgi:signal transduction histidine kinase
MSATLLSKTTAHSPSKPQGSAIALWRVVIGALAALATVVFVIAVITGFSYRSRPFLGVMVSNTQIINAGVSVSDTNWVGREAGLLPGDRIIGINGTSLADEPYTSAQAIFNQQLQSSSGDTVTLTIERAGSRPAGDICTEQLANGNYRCTVELATMQLPDVDFLSYIILPLASAFVTLAIGFAILFYRNDKPEGLITAVIAFLSSIFAAGIFNTGTDGLLAPIWLISACWLGASMITLGFTFPKRLNIVRSAPWLEYVPLAIATVGGLLLVYVQLFPPSPQAPLDAHQAASLAATSGVVLLVGLSFLQREYANTPITRDQSSTILIGALMVVVPGILWVISRTAVTMLQSSIILNLESMMVLLIFPNAATAYAVLQYRQRNIDEAISHSLTYGIMVGALIVSMFLLTLGGTLIAIDLFNATNVITLSVILLGMVLFFTPLRNYLQERIDAVYFRKKHNLQLQVENFARQLARMDSYENITASFFELLRKNIAPSAAFIFLRESVDGDYVAHASEPSSKHTDLRFAADSPMIELLRGSSDPLSLQPGQPWPDALWVDRARLNLLRAYVIAPMQGSEELNGFVIIGAPQASTMYNYDDVHFISNVVNQLAISTERSQVIESLESRVNELNVLSQVSKAINFDIDQDDLLELISTQTEKLIPSSYFFIALYDEKLSQLYFAFYQHEGERLEEHEKVRWDLGMDLFSEVVKTGRPLRVSDYHQAMQQRRANLDRVPDHIRAWMGVPLAGKNETLGLIATGKTDSTAEFTENQFRILSDISVLAATSMENANLFNETKIRERQLTVLNDISRQLVAAELDVEKLLELIMHSAVDILEAEAGSLLLTTTDGSGDLEFRVVIGGSGEDLLGTRVPAGQGIVGQVVQSVEPKIVNDTSKNPEQQAKVSDDFISHALLAVPLIAKDEVIGVLEVINKKNKLPFLNEDAELLTTFAGQAAVAIENARLFELTDQQLAERVKELEMLERMDAELNRTLDLYEVSDITVRWATTVLKADAGLLAIIHPDEDMAEIVCSRGYDEEDYPEGAEGDRWPLSKGIVARVLRSKQADYQKDLHIDPDYVPSLRDSNSQLTIPMVSGDDVNAVLVLEKNSEPPFNITEWDLAKRLAEHASISIANAQFASALTQANAGKSEFMGFAAHELKNPLSSVKGYAEVLQSGMLGDLSDKQEEFISIIHANARRMETIISDLRTAAQIDANQFTVDPEPMDIYSTIVETLRPFVRPLEDKNQNLVNNVPEDLPPILGDEARIMQVMTNLVSNAHKYSPEDTTITVQAAHHMHFVAPDGQRMGEVVQISVIDEGIGMTLEDQQKLFRERYFRAENEATRSQPGTGLGMMLTKGIIDRHNGKIWIESEYGQGSTFHIVFPVAKLEIPPEEISAD